MKKILLIFLGLIIVIVGGLLLLKYNYHYIKESNSSQISEEKNPIQITDEEQLYETTESIIKVDKKSITISAVGDCTIGSDPNFGYSGTFHQEYDNQTPDYFFGGVIDILGNDDITLANLETTFTETVDKVPKAFNFKGPAKYTEILKTGSVEIVNIANNHTFDYGDIGYQDTKTALYNAGIPYAGNNDYYVYEISGLKIGFIGYYANYNDKIYEEVEEGLNNLKKENVDLIIVSFHWGVETISRQNDNQKNLGRWVIDNGGDLVIGHGPHVIQGIEKYNDKYIVYSLANFVFGGNRNPKDKDTFIFQQTFNFENKNLIDTSINIIPASVSSVKNRNNYRPVALEGSEKDRVMSKIKRYSENVIFP